jgi:hypothetical protein
MDELVSYIASDTNKSSITVFSFLQFDSKVVQGQEIYPDFSRSTKELPLAISLV